MQWTNEQVQIIEHGTGHAKVMAVAGSGKSEVLAERAVRLLKGGTSAKKMLIVMFNTAAAKDFSKRLTHKLQGSRYAAPEVKTFHALSLSLCTYLAKQGYIPNWQLDSRGWVESKLAAQALSLITGRKPTNEDVEALVDFIGLVKSDIVSADDKHEDAMEITGKPIPPHYIEAYERFEELRAEQGLRFFSDLTRDAVLALMADSAMADEVSDKLDHILIDEYQDISEVQQALMTILAGTRASVMAIGDVDQCIYEWRGAKPEYLQSLFDVDFPNPVVYSLSYTFRYGHKLSLVASHVIRNNSNRDGQFCISHDTTPNTDIQALSYKLDHEHPAITAIKEWHDSGRLLSEVAILVRLYGMSAAIELGLLKNKIPYIGSEKHTVFGRKEVKMIAGYVQLAANRVNASHMTFESAVDHVAATMGYPSLGITNQQVRVVAEVIVRAGVNAPAGVSAALAGKNYPAWVEKKMQQRAKLISEASAMGPATPASAVYKHIEKQLNLKAVITKEAQSIEAAHDQIAVCEGLRDFFGSKSASEAAQELSELAGASLTSQGGIGRDAVTITSIHRAKGLEFPLVILPELREGGFPTGQSKGSQAIEAERRLFYVGVTRAKEKLILIHPEDEGLQWQSAIGAAQPEQGIKPIASRFLYEANISASSKVGAEIYGETTGKKVSVVESAVLKAYLAAVQHPDCIELVSDPIRQDRPVCGPNAPCAAKKGMRVRHEAHGKGVITQVSEVGQRTSINVLFAGKKERIIIASKDYLYEDDGLVVKSKPTALTPSGAPVSVFFRT